MQVEYRNQHKYLKKTESLRETIIGQLQAIENETNLFDLEASLLKKYGLKNIQKRKLFVNLNIAFFAAGIVSWTTLLTKKINAFSITGIAITLAIGFMIFHISKKYGERIE